MESQNIERFFLRNLLRISLTGVTIILITDFILYPADKLSLIIDVAIVSACAVSYVLQRRFYTISVLLLTGITLAAMVYQCLSVPINTTTSMSIILIVGFIFSILLKDKLMWIMHGITGALIAWIFVLQTTNPALRSAPTNSETVTMAITYFVLYAIISYCTGILKLRYDKITLALMTANEALQEKAREIEDQHQELVQSHADLNELNQNLERIVAERTQKIHLQHEQLLKYTYTNAHHLRGPVARLLGLISVHKLEAEPDTQFFFDKMEDQAKEIDSVVKQINAELEK